ncbi:hypothetical protein J6590_037746 [Homalodisca vitripennis]|nr:hypothetical protein J6590_037746 [Homalodisca vitripennis]
MVLVQIKDNITILVALFTMVMMHQPQLSHNVGYQSKQTYRITLTFVTPLRVTEMVLVLVQIKDNITILVALFTMVMMHQPQLSQQGCYSESSSRGFSQNGRVNTGHIQPLFGCSSSAIISEPLLEETKKKRVVNRTEEDKVVRSEQNPPSARIDRRKNWSQCLPDVLD